MVITLNVVDKWPACVCKLYELVCSAYCCFTVDQCECFCSRHVKITLRIFFIKNMFMSNNLISCYFWLNSRLSRKILQLVVVHFKETQQDVI